ncbi:putative phage baseplate assembly protein [Mycobacterium sp. AZCC_0083]|nr:putative phage baseplate assembly protein [Mycobacterium sp. AZCC_0083]
MMVDQLIYRLNRVPDRHYIKFLDLLGLQLRPPGAAQAEVTFWLSAPQPQAVTVRAETEVSTDRTDVEEPIVFSTTEQLDIVPCSLDSGRVVTVAQGGQPEERRNDATGPAFASFSTLPTPGDAMWVGLSDAVPSCVVLLRFDCRVSGVGVNPDNPPYVWEAWTGGSTWEPCEVERDETRAFNRPGDVVLHVPRGHGHGTPAGISGQPKGWLRCRLLDATPERPSYRESPIITSITACTVGGTARIIHARVVRDEVVGSSDGTPGQRLVLQQRPALPWTGNVLSVIDGNTITEWHQVDSFASADESTPCFNINSVAGEVHFGPAIRESDGAVKQYGAIPPKSAILRMSAYRTGGGQKGNVSIGQIRVLKTSVPYVSRVQNRRAAVGGADAETLDEVKARGPLLLQTRGKAVTAEDFQQLTLQVAPEIGRAECLTAAHESHAGLVRVLVIPNVASDDFGQVRREDLIPLTDTVERIAEYLDQRRVVGTRVVVEPPAYRGLRIAVRLSAVPGSDREQLRNNVIRVMNLLFHPLKGGPDGRGWPLGRAVQPHEVSAALAWVGGVDLSEEVDIKLFEVDASGVAANQPVPRLMLPRNGLVFSLKPSVRIA